ncbi:hypothetical protein PGIGA_G00075010, partial [Pangasianodon gigas]|nr:hypothetical protein [Pangasianodon gigas]
TVCLSVFFISENHRRIDSFLEHIHLSTAGFIKHCLQSRPDLQVTLFLSLHTLLPIRNTAPHRSACSRRVYKGRSELFLKLFFFC